VSSSSQQVLASRASCATPGWSSFDRRVAADPPSRAHTTSVPSLRKFHHRDVRYPSAELVPVNLLSTLVTAAIQLHHRKGWVQVTGIMAVTSLRADARCQLQTQQSCSRHSIPRPKRWFNVRSPGRPLGGESTHSKQTGRTPSLLFQPLMSSANA
jgi:hypothetical protein